MPSANLAQYWDITLNKYLIANAVLVLLLFNLFYEDHSMHFLSLIRWAYLESFYWSNAVLFSAINLSIFLYSQVRATDAPLNEQNSEPKNL